jgi:four helix bundle protein
MTNDQRVFDLSERTAKFGEAVLEFVAKLPQTLINQPLISQLVRSGTSIGVNYQEADGAESKRDFHHKIAITKKESKETLHWLRMIAKCNPSEADTCRCLWQEAHELTLIFARINSHRYEDSVKPKSNAE